MYHRHSVKLFRGLVRQSNVDVLQLILLANKHCWANGSFGGRYLGNHNYQLTRDQAASGE